MDCFIDSNVWLYAFIESQDEDKARDAQALIAEREPAVSTQIVNEICVNLISQANFSEAEVRALITSFYRRYPLFTLTSRVMVRRRSFVKNMRFRFGTA